MILSERVRNSLSSSTVQVADRAQRLREEGETVYDFSAGRSFEPTPDDVSEAAVEAIRSGDTHQTMALGKTSYRRAIAEKLRRDNGITADPDRELIATMGCKQGLTISLLATIDHGNEVIVEDPCFVSYKQIIGYLGGKAVEVPLREENRFRWTRADLEQQITPATRVIVMCNPHNPTGVVYRPEDLQVVADLAIRHNLTVITDEVYERVVWGRHRHTCLATLPGMKERTITLMSFTKSYSMGGWRIGFIYSSADIVRQLEKLQQHMITSVNSFVQTGAEAACRPPGVQVRGYWTEWEKKIRYTVEKINEIKGLSCQMPEGGFYAWVKIELPGISSSAFTERLLDEQKVAVVDGASFGKMGEGYFRFTCVKSWDELEEGLARLKLFVSGL